MVVSGGVDLAGAIFAIGVCLMQHDAPSRGKSHRWRKCGRSSATDASSRRQRWALRVGSSEDILLLMKFRFSRFGERCATTDQPIAGLLKDLKLRVLLKDTLVVCW